MSYGRRFSLALTGSLLGHVSLLLLFAALRSEPVAVAPTRYEPLVLTLKLPAPTPPRQVVDVHTPADTAVAPTDLIAAANSKATDTELREGDDPGPRFDEVDRFDTLAMQAPPRPTRPPPPRVPRRPAMQALQAARSQPEVPRQRAVPEDAEPAPPAEESEARLQIAQAEARSAEEPLARVSKGRRHNAVKHMGVVGFEAIQDDIAPYLKKIRRRVERLWTTALLTRYSGSSPTDAVIDCVIRPDGHVAFAQIVGWPEDRVFAAICRDAIVKAGPFGPFPFRVPAMYRNKNLEIQWTFGFLQ